MGRRQRTRIQYGGVLAVGGLALALGLSPAGPARAAEAPSVTDLGLLSLEELSDIQVTSVSKRGESVSQAPAAVYVITREDIRRSGAVSLVEALRLAPNLDVARLNTASYTVTARGFNSPESANKLLVLIDGRSIYTPLASTVFWEAQGLVLGDIERIEVVSGPGGTLWGANAVNGVINVITRNAADTQGVLVNVGGGTRDQVATVRYGGALGDKASFRLYGQARSSDFAEDGFAATGGQLSGVHGGFRIDAASDRDSYTLQGDLYRDHAEYLDETLKGGNLLARWRRDTAGGALQLQAYYDRADRAYAVASDSLNTFDLQAQYDTALGERQRIVLGAEYRVWRSEFNSLVGFGFTDPAATLNLGNLFVQDEIALRPDLKLTLGLKLETNDYSGSDYMPTARLAWQPTERTLLWSSISRAVRTPSRIDRELTGLGVLAPAPDFGSEKLVAYEAGYRGQPSAALSLSVSAFYNVYDDLRTAELINGGLPGALDNGLKGETYGVEAWAKYAVAPWWRLSAGVATLEKNMRLKPGHMDVARLQSVGQDPSYRVEWRSQMDLSDRLQLDVGMRRVGRVSPSNVPAYTEAEARIGWWLTDTLQLSLAGFNLLHAEHLEVIATGTAPVTPIPRSVFLSLRWER